MLQKNSQSVAAPARAGGEETSDAAPAVASLPYHIIQYCVAPKGRQRYRLADGTPAAYAGRMFALQGLIMGRGRFQKEEAWAALNSDDPQSKEPVARWLSSELEELRDGEAKSRDGGASPVLSGDALSRLVIGDLAFAMLECHCAPGPELLFLLQALLNVDRHRADLANSPGRKFNDAACYDGQAALQGYSYGVNELARLVSASPSTVSAWKKSAAYQRQVERYREAWTKTLRDRVDELRAHDSELTEEQAFELAFRIKVELRTEEELTAREVLNKEELIAEELFELEVPRPVPSADFDYALPEVLVAMEHCANRCIPRRKRQPEK